MKSKKTRGAVALSLCVAITGIGAYSAVAWSWLYLVAVVAGGIGVWKAAELMKEGEDDGKEQAGS